MNHSALADKVLVSQVIPPQSLTALVNSSAVDMSGWDGVQFVIAHGVFGAAGTLNAYVQRDDNSGFNSPTNVANAALTQITNAAPNGVAIIDVYRPSERYVRIAVTGQTNGVQAGVTAHRYRRNGILPPTQAAVQVVRIVEN